MKSTVLKTVSTTVSTILISLSTITAAATSPAPEAANETKASTAQLSERVARPVSVSVGFNSPAPSLLGVNVSYSLNDSYRLKLGWGNMEMTSSYEWNGSEFVENTSSINTLGVGAEWTLQGWNFTPVVGINAAYVMYGGEKALKVGGFDSNGGHVYSNIGFDYQQKNGYNIAMGYNLSMNGGEKSGIYINAGWAFDWENLL